MEQMVGTKNQKHWWIRKEQHYCVGLYIHITVQLNWSGIKYWHTTQFRIKFQAEWRNTEVNWPWSQLAGSCLTVEHLGSYCFYYENGVHNIMKMASKLFCAATLNEPNPVSCSARTMQKKTPSHYYFSGVRTQFFFFRKIYSQSIF